MRVCWALVAFSVAHFLGLGTLLLAQAPDPGVRVRFLYHLSDFNGRIPYSDVVLNVDRERNETYAMVGNSVRVFGGTGLEIFRFDHDPLEYQIFDLAVEESGEILLLTYEARAAGEKRAWWITRCDYRGQEIERVTARGLPEDLAGFGPNRIFSHDDTLTLVSRQRLLAVSLEADGEFVASYDLGQLGLVEEPEKQEISGLDVDAGGNFLFTISALFKAYVVAPDGTSRQFGAPGSVPGRFGIVSGIAGDDHGNILVADKLRGVVMVFDKTLRFRTELSEAGSERLARPTDLVMGVNGKFYVTQARDKGVAVFRLTPLATEGLSPASPVGGEEPSLP